eukprot:CAMPEP_0172162998 /NCGR_PEP_ID=MMETSP1050-20130122/7019_1 /TAXON_ID=233186 /ORGANISM="Cryptomonas curvata, Strain CCAP979/52" /LENGTH=356 /DNA_ID=CAMNT_0012833123 /DNA_START=291 /DNA_END=1357 /DNA_ORIENTATION=-
MQEQDWENLGTVVDLESDIPWDGLPSGSAESQGSGADSLAANHAPLHFSNDNQDEFDISWLGSKQPKQSVHMQFNAAAPDNMSDCAFESIACWSGPPPQRGLPISVSPKTLRKPSMVIEQSCDDQESSDESYSQDAEDSLPLIDDDSCSHLSAAQPLHRPIKAECHSDDDHTAAAFFPDRAAPPPHCGFPVCSAASLSLPPAGPTALFPLHLFVAALADGAVAPDTPERTLTTLDQVRRKASKEHNVVVQMGNQEVLDLKMRVFTMNSLEARALSEYIAAHPQQVPAPFVVLARDVRMAALYDPAAGDPAQQAGAAERLRKQLRTHAVRVVREAIGEEARLTADMLRGLCGATAPS